MSRYFLNDCFYFITVPTKDHCLVFDDLSLRDKLLSRLQLGFGRFNLSRNHFSIMADHYHLLVKVDIGSVIPKLLHFVNGGISFELHDTYPKKLWGEYHVFVPMTEELCERVLGYVVGNPIKHGDVLSIEELMTWRFSTFDRLVEQEGKKRAEEIVSYVIQMSENQFIDSLPGRG